jgi:hypothetical protein
MRDLESQQHTSFALQKFQAPNNKLQTITKSQIPMIQTTEIWFSSTYKQGLPKSRHRL